MVAGDGKFFLGSDSAPHPVAAKFPSHENGKAAAGVFTQPYVTQLVLSALEGAVAPGVVPEGDVTQEKLAGFLGGSGRAFYGIKDEHNEKIELFKNSEVIADRIGEGDVRIVPFRRGQEC